MGAFGSVASSKDALTMLGTVSLPSEEQITGIFLAMRMETHWEPIATEGGDVPGIAEASSRAWIIHAFTEIAVWSAKVVFSRRVPILIVKVPLDNSNRSPSYSWRRAERNQLNARRDMDKFSPIALPVASLVRCSLQICAYRQERDVSIQSGLWL
jgi:hypothetical protein